MSSRNTNNSGEDKLAELHEQITQGVAALVTSEAWRAMLETAARFHTYSLSNVLLIAMQAPDATRVAGFRTWQSLGRQVRKGERGIAILAPCTYRPKKTATSAEGAAEPASTSNDDSSGGQATTPAPTPVAGRRVRGFRRAYVFDVAQTEGESLPDVAPVLLSGQAPAGLWDTLAEQVAGHGYTLERGQCRGANGYTDPATRTVRIRGDVDDAQAVKTLAHELGHIECGHVEDLPTYLTCRGRCEVEAESVAYVVSASAGLDTGGYSFAYVAGWAGGEVAVVRQSAETVTAAARTILTKAATAAGEAGQTPAQPGCRVMAGPLNAERATQDA